MLQKKVSEKIKTHILWNNMKCQLDATRWFYWCILSSTCFEYIRVSSGALDVKLQHMVFCTEFLDGWWSWEPLRRCGWCRARRHPHRTHDLGTDVPQISIQCIRIAFWITKDTNRHPECSTYCFSTAAMVARTRLDITPYVLCLSSCFWEVKFLLGFKHIKKTENSIHFYM